jgi:hypothetical protein
MEIENNHTAMTGGQAITCKVIGGSESLIYLVMVGFLAHNLH